MIRNIKLGLGLIAALTFSIAMTTSASAASFLSSAKEKLLSANVATQKFQIDEGTVECTKTTITSGESAGVETTELAATVKYENCKAFGFITLDISPAEYGFLANGEVHLKKLVSINVLGLGCEISVPAQAINKVDYTTNGKNLLLEPLVTGIKYTASPGCSPSGTLANGTYAGHSEMMIPNGTLGFMSGGVEEGPGKLSFVDTEDPFKIIVNNTSEFLVEYKGTGESGKLTVSFEAGKLFTLQGGTCQNGRISKSGGTCSVQIKCGGEAKEKGEVDVSSAAPSVTAASKKLECT